MPADPTDPEEIARLQALEDAGADPLKYQLLLDHRGLEKFDRPIPDAQKRYAELLDSAFVQAPIEPP